MGGVDLATPLDVYYADLRQTITSNFAPGASSDLQRRGIFDDIVDAVGDAVDTISDGLGT